MKKTLIYQMYPTSWGSFKEMEGHLPRVAKLKVDYIWLSPIFESPWVDGGYDVSNYYDIDPRFGTMKDFDHFVKEAKRYRIKILLDLVLNHTSTKHEWFKESQKTNPEYKDYYVWTSEDLGWNNGFDGRSAFEYDENRGKYYLHLFHPTQADLNWDNPKVISEFQKIIDFWTLEHGVAGFRLDVAQYLCKNLSKTRVPKKFGIIAGFFKYWQKPGTINILHELFDDRRLFMFSESGFLTKRMMRKLAGPKGPLTAAQNVVVTGVPGATGHFWLFKLLLKHWSKEPEFVVCHESHDTPRFTSRCKHSGKEILETIFNSKANIVCLYQGTELGLKNPELSVNEIQDIQTLMRMRRLIDKGIGFNEAFNKFKSTSRDNARVPIDIAEYVRQENDSGSCFNYCVELIQQWKKNVNPPS